MRAEIQRNTDELDTAKERYMASCNVLIKSSLIENPDPTERDKAFADAKTYNKSIQELKETIAQLELNLVDLQKSHALRAAKTPTSAGPAFKTTSTLRYDTSRTPSALVGDGIAQYTGSIGHMLSNSKLNSLSLESAVPTAQVAGDRVVSTFALRLNRRLTEANNSSHVWISNIDMQIEHPSVRAFRLGLWQLLKNALTDVLWLFEKKITCDVSALSRILPHATLG